jgi:hypothetical protein
MSNVRVAMKWGDSEVKGFATFMLRTGLKVANTKLVARVG